MFRGFYTFPLAIFLSFSWTGATHYPGRSDSGDYVSAKIREKAKAAQCYASLHGLNTRLCFLADMSLPSGQNRFFVYDLAGDSLRMAGLVTHGRCNQDWLEGRRFGNEVGCGCTSLGRYRIGHSYIGRFGLAFKLHGLDKTNDNAFARFVVLHAHACVPENETAEEICQSDGCPTVAPGFLRRLKSILGNPGKPILLWVFD